MKLYRILEFRRDQSSLFSQMVFVHRWSLFRGHLYNILMGTVVVFVDRLSLFDYCCARRALKVSKLHNFVTIQDKDMFDTSF